MSIVEQLMYLSIKYFLILSNRLTLSKNIYMDIFKTLILKHTTLNLSMQLKKNCITYQDQTYILNKLQQ